MSHQLKVILNPRGGGLNRQAKIDLIEKGLQGAGLSYELELTRYRRHALELAKEAALAHWPVVVAAGGDGTINEVVNGLMQAANQAPLPRLGIIPFGSANDLADILSLPRNITLACRRIAAGNTRLIDVCRVNDCYFVNNSAMGLESMVTLQQDQMRRLKGNLRYIVAALKSIIQASSWQVRLEWDHGIFEGPLTLVSVGNSRRTGGAFFMTPRAEPDDGLLDFIYAFQMSRWQMLKLLPQTFSGKHVHHPLVTYLQTTSLCLTVSPPTPIQADGEIIDQNATEIRYQIYHKKLPVIV